LEDFNKDKLTAEEAAEQIQTWFDNNWDNQ